MSINTYYKGRKLGDIWGYTTIGIANSQEEMDAHLAKADQSSLGSQWGAGDIMYADLNGDGVINTDAQKVGDTGDYRIIGNNTPRFKFGLTLDASWKNWDFRVFFQGVAKRDLWLSGCYFWGANTQTRYLQNGAYMRMKNIQLGYSLPASWIKHAGMTSARVYISADNLLTFTSLSKIFDPEATESMAGTTGSGKLYPLQRVISLGVNVNF